MGRRWGARRMIVLGLALVAVGNAMLPFAEFVPRAWQADWLIVARLPRAFGFALSIVNAGPFLLSITTRVERIHVFAVQAAMWPIAGFAGNLVGGVLPGIFAALMEASLDGPAPYRYPLFLAAVMIVPAALAVAATKPTPGSLAVGGSDGESPRPRGPMAAVAGGRLPLRHLHGDPADLLQRLHGRLPRRADGADRSRRRHRHAGERAGGPVDAADSRLAGSAGDDNSDLAVGGGGPAPGHAVG